MKVSELIKLLQALPQDAECKSYEHTVDDYMPIVEAEYNPKELTRSVFLSTQADLDV
jgi:hypothetical protein